MKNKFCINPNDPACGNTYVQKAISLSNGLYVIMYSEGDFNCSLTTFENK